MGNLEKPEQELIDFLYQFSSELLAAVFNYYSESSKIIFQSIVMTIN